MEDSMTRFLATAALTAVLLGSALSQALAADSDGIWKVDAAKSSFSSGAATLSIERVAEVASGAGAFIVVSEGNVYLVTGASASDNRGTRQVDYDRMTTQGKAVLLGKNARSRDVCGFRCQGGLPERKISLSFQPVSGADQHLNDMLAQRN
jgi:hypothetical protein